MKFRSFIFGLAVVGTALLAACGESSGQTPVRQRLPLLRRSPLRL